MKGSKTTVAYTSQKMAYAYRLGLPVQEVNMADGIIPPTLAKQHVSQGRDLLSIASNDFSHQGDLPSENLPPDRSTRLGADHTAALGKYRCYMYDPADKAMSPPYLGCILIIPEGEAFRWVQVSIKRGDEKDIPIIDVIFNSVRIHTNR